MAEVSVREARRRFSRLLQRVAEGEEIVISRAGKAVARLVPIRSVSERVLGIDRGIVELPDDFDAPLPPDVMAAFEQFALYDLDLRRP